MKFQISGLAAALSLACFAALPMCAMATGQTETADAVIQPNYQIISCDYKAITGYFLTGLIWTTGCQQAWVLESNFDKPVGTQMNICPNQQLPTGWVLISIDSVSSSCPNAIPFKGPIWRVLRNA
jgi:hypothetical protein